MYEGVNVIDPEQIDLEKHMEALESLGKDVSKLKEFLDSLNLQTEPSQV